MKDVPVLLLTGYLGSGKTTLVNRILSNKKGIKFAVIVNDIGEVNIGKPYPRKRERNQVCSYRQRHWRGEY